MINYDEILNTIVAAGSKNTDANAKNYLKTDIIGNTIVGRFLPNINDIEHSVEQVYSHGWKSKLDNSGVFQLCPNTYQEKCPSCTNSIKMWKGTDPVAKEQSKQIRRRQNWVVNFYVISDAKHPENNGLVKILKYGMQIKQKYDMATTGDDKLIYGPKIWRLDDQGCNFRIKCEQNSESKEAWPTYTNSGFLPASKIEGMTDEKIKEILEKVFDLTKLHQRRSYDDLLAELNKHFFTNDVISINTQSSRPAQPSLAAVTQQLSQPTTEVITIPITPTPPSTQTSESAEAPKVTQITIVNTPEAVNTSNTTASESEIDKMLKELQGS